MIGSQAAAKCSYDGNSITQGMTLNNIKIPTDASIPVGSVLYSKKIGTGKYKTFKCSKVMNDQYIIDISAPIVADVTGLQGGPVYETGIDGLGFQVSDLLRSRNGHIVAAEAGSTVVPIENSSDNYYQFVTLWLIKTKAVIDTSGTGIDPSVSYSVGNISTNPKKTDRLLYSISGIYFKNINYRSSSCNISTPRSQVTLNRIDINQLMSLSRGAVTPAQKTIAMNIDCPSASIGNTVTYWFNPVGAASTAGDGIVDNMLSGAIAASKVGIIFKLAGSPVVFYDMDKYNYKITNSSMLSNTINLTADYYRSSDVSSEVTTGNVKAMLEVVIQED